VIFDLTIGENLCFESSLLLLESFWITVLWKSWYVGDEYNWINLKDGSWPWRENLHRITDIGVVSDYPEYFSRTITPQLQNRGPNTRFEDTLRPSIPCANNCIAIENMKFHCVVNITSMQHEKATLCTVVVHNHSRFWKYALLSTNLLATSCSGLRPFFS